MVISRVYLCPAASAKLFRGRRGTNDAYHEVRGVVFTSHEYPAGAGRGARRLDATDGSPRRAITGSPGRITTAGPRGASVTGSGHASAAGGDIETGSSAIRRQTSSHTTARLYRTARFSASGTGRAGARIQPISVRRPAARVLPVSGIQRAGVLPVSDIWRVAARSGIRSAAARVLPSSRIRRAAARLLRAPSVQLLLQLRSLLRLRTVRTLAGRLLAAVVTSATPHR
jgi:hypothetical protein